MKKKKDTDQNIIDALLSLDWPLLNYDNHRVRVRKVGRKEGGLEHIANKKHLLKIRDILLLPAIFSNPYKVVIQHSGIKGKIYFGKRKGKEKSIFLKIVVRKLKDENEEIVTIYSTNVIK